MRVGDVLLVVLLVGIMLVGIYVFNQKAKYKQDKEEWLQTKADLQVQIDVASAKAVEEERNAVEALARADEYADDKKELQEQLRVERLGHARVLNQIKTLAPDQIVIAHHYHLDVGSTEVWLNSFGIQFTLDASRKNLTVLERYEFLIKTEIPNYQSQMAKQESENKELRLSNTGYSNSNKQLHIEIDALKLQVGGETDLRGKAEKQVGFNFLSTEAVLVFLGGMVLGGLVAGVF